MGRQQFWRDIIPIILLKVHVKKTCQTNFAKLLPVHFAKANLVQDLRLQWSVHAIDSLTAGEIKKNVTVRTFHICSEGVHGHIFLPLGVPGAM